MSKRMRMEQRPIPVCAEMAIVPAGRAEESCPAETDGKHQGTLQQQSGFPGVYSRGRFYLARSLFFLAAVLVLTNCHRAWANAPLAGGDKKQGTFAFKCGTNLCDAHTSYCEVINTDVPKLPSTYSCKPLPKSCRANATGPALKCGCFPRGTRCDFCDVLETHGVYYLHRMCVGGE
jgi:hypothetical protein